MLSVCTSRLDEKPKPPFVEEVAKVCDDPVCPFRDVSPPPAPASAPQENCPVVEFQRSLDPPAEHDVSPAPKTYPELSCKPRVTSTAPAKVEVAEVSPRIVVVAVLPVER